MLNTRVLTYNDILASFIVLGVSPATYTLDSEISGRRRTLADVSRRSQGKIQGLKSKVE